MEQYVLETVTANDHDRNANYDAGDTFEMYTVNYTTRGPSRGVRWYNCEICGLSYPKDKVLLKGGAAYCVPLKHYEEMDPSRKALDF